MHAEDACLTYLEVNNQPIVSVDRISKDTVGLSVSTDAIGQYSADVIAKDDCGASSKMTYRVLVVANPPVTSHSAPGDVTQCKGTQLCTIGISITCIFFLIFTHFLLILGFGIM